MNQCVILVGGKGSRLGEITKNFPKPMLNIDDKPFIIHLIDQVKKFGFKDILLLTGHSANIVDDYFENNIINNISINFIKLNLLFHEIYWKYIQKKILLQLLDHLS